MNNKNNTIFINMDALRKFNDNASEFLQKMAKTFPNEPKIGEYKGMFEGLRLINQKTTVELFMAGVEPYGAQILRRDEQFFKTDQYVKEAESMSGRLGLVEIWDSIDAQTKDAIWSYMQTLYVLGMKSLGKEAELKAVIASIR
jgi:hypothetical protein